MFRRTLLKALGAVCASLVSCPAWASLEPRYEVEDACDILGPGLNAFRWQNPDLSLRMFADIMTKNILVIGYFPALGASLGFCLTQESIKAGFYKAEFAPALTALIRVLRGAPVASWYASSETTFETLRLKHPEWKEYHG